MKTIKSLGLALAAILMGFTSCTEDENFNSSNSAGEFCINATIPGYTFNSGTRVNISEDLQTFTWETGDLLGVYYSDSNVDAFSGFKIKQGGGSTGSFSNGSAFDLKKSTTYYAFYPFSSEATINAAPVDYTGQVQTENGSTAHLSDYNYMYGKLTTDASGQGSVNFNNLGAVMQIKLTAPAAGTYKTLTVSSDNSPFITKGTASMINGAITAVESSATMALSFGDGLILATNDVLTANLLVAPVNMSESNLTFILKDEAGNEYHLALNGKNMLQGRAYLYDGESSSYEEINSTPYVTFTSDVTQAFQISKIIPTLEYSVNGGEWEIVGNNTITFGGTKGDLRLRGKSSVGTNSATISFVNATKVACSGDIRTLIDYENYTTVSTSNVSFQDLFYNCAQLTSAPELPATTLASRCYESMFSGCTYLTQAPELPATTLADYCYQNMFQGCTALTQAPELPATNLSGSCYVSMFKGCTALTQAPELPATTLTDWCYSNMFSECTSLTLAPELPATTLAGSCYASMFSGCTALTQAPELPATTLASSCYYNMFYGCTSLTQAPELPGTNLADSCYYSMFQGCTSLIQAPELPATKLTMECYRSMFRGCTSLTHAPELPATKLDLFCYISMFQGCTSLTHAPELPATTLAEWCYSNMFDSCTSLTQAPELPATTLASNCYSNMFFGCTSLTQAPELPATTLVDYCYNGIFNGCTKLNYIKMMAINIPGSEVWEIFSHWVNGVSSTGTFVKNKNAIWDPSLFDLVPIIPSGWTVETASE